MALQWKNMFKSMRNKRRTDAETETKVLNEHYDITNIDNTGATYRMIIGQRSNGKTYSVYKHHVYPL